MGVLGTYRCRLWSAHNFGELDDLLTCSQLHSSARWSFAFLCIIIKLSKMSTMDIPRNCSPLSQQRLVIDIRNARYLCFLLQLLQVRGTKHWRGIRSSWQQHRSTFRTGWLVVPLNSSSKCVPPEVRGGNGLISNTYMRRMDICDIDRWSQLARYIHDIIYSRNTALDLGVHSSKSKQREGRQISEVSCEFLFWDSCTPHLLLHPAQGPQDCRR